MSEDEDDANDCSHASSSRNSSTEDEYEGVIRAGSHVSRLGKQKYDAKSVRKLLKPEAIAARGLKEWARLEPVYTIEAGFSLPIILYDSPSRQPSIIGRGFLPANHDPALFHPLPSPRISRVHALVWRELRDYNGDNTDINNYVIKIHSQGSTGTTISRLRPGYSAANGEGEREVIKMQKDTILDLDYDPNAGYRLILGNKLYSFEYKLTLSPCAPLIPRGPPPTRVECLVDQFSGI